jgi:hypothetical protein
MKTKTGIPYAQSSFSAFSVTHFQNFRKFRAKIMHNFFANIFRGTVVEKEKHKKFTKFCGSQKNSGELITGPIYHENFVKTCRKMENVVFVRTPSTYKCTIVRVCVCSAGGCGVPHVSCAGWLGVPGLRLQQQVHHRRAPPHREQARGGPRGLGVHDLRPPGGQCVNLQAALFVSARHQALKHTLFFI